MDVQLYSQQTNIDYPIDDTTRYRVVIDKKSQELPFVLINGLTRKSSAEAHAIDYLRKCKQNALATVLIDDEEIKEKIISFWINYKV